MENIEKKLQYIMDRMEIEDQIKRYAHIIDRRKSESLEEVFTPDAWIDYRASGGEAGNLAETRKFLKRTIWKMFSSTQHLMGNFTVDIAEDGKTARSENILFNPMTRNTKLGPYTFFCGLWYHIDWVKTEEGIWKMKKCVQENSYAYHRPLPKK